MIESTLPVSIAISMLDEQGRQYLLEEYGVKKRSTHDIAKEQRTYPNKVRQALLKHGIPLRNKSEAQLAAIDGGRHFHPTKGKKRSAEEKNKIGETVANNWKNIGEDEKEKRRENSRIQWEEMDPDDKKELLSLAGKGMRKASIEGSKLEKYLLVALQGSGYKAQMHAEFLISAEAMHVDLILPDEKIVIEIDGPTHHLPIWGQEKLNYTIQADKKKNGLLIMSGYTVIRIKNLHKTTSEYHKRLALKLILEKIIFVKQNPPDELNRLILLEI